MFSSGFFFVEGGAIKFSARSVMLLKRRPGFATLPGRRPIRPLGNRGGLSRAGQGL
jgi:hypothetical protein